MSAAVYEMAWLRRVSDVVREALPNVKFDRLMLRNDDFMGGRHVHLQIGKRHVSAPIAENSDEFATAQRLVVQIIEATAPERRFKRIRAFRSKRSALLAQRRLMR